MTNPIAGIRMERVGRDRYRFESEFDEHARVLERPRNYFTVSWAVVENGRKLTHTRFFFFTTLDECRLAWFAAEAELDRHENASLPVVYKHAKILLFTCETRPDYFQVLP